MVVLATAMTPAAAMIASGRSPAAIPATTMLSAGAARIAVAGTLATAVTVV